MQSMAMPDSQRFPVKFNLIKNEWDIYNFENWLFSIVASNQK